ncbi:MAG: surface lipoprotein assembly modifier [Lautropia sp.]|nr:surface lipoprotein assembly modifier [Lautropia sp.]
MQPSARLSGPAASTLFPAPAVGRSHDHSPPPSIGMPCQTRLAQPKRLSHTPRTLAQALLALGLGIGILLPMAGRASSTPLPSHDLAPSQASFSSLPALLRQARLHLNHQPEAAWQLLEPYTWHYAGSRDFDYLLGLAALDSHHPSQAVMALERVLANYPDDVGARTELVRAYLALGEQSSAWQTLQQLLQYPQLPGDARQEIQQYLDIISGRPSLTGKPWQAHLDITAGQDSNVNAGSTHSRWVIDDGQVLTPLAESLPQPSPFLEQNLQFQQSGQLSDTTIWSADAQISQRLNTRQHPQDTGTMGASGGLAWKLGAHRLSMGISLQQMWLARQRFRRALGWLAQWQFEPGPLAQIGLYLQHFQLLFNQQPQRDAYRTIVGATWTWATQGQRHTNIIINPYGGRERARHAVPALGFHLHGLRLGLQHELTGRWQGRLGIQWENRQYHDSDPIFGRIRHDHQTDLTVGLEYAFSDSLQLTPLFLLTRNHASLAPSDFRRQQWLLELHYQW